MASELTSFRDVLSYAIGGGWGAELPDDKNTVAVTIVRGTDFGKLGGQGASDIPRRFEAGSKVAKRTLVPGDIVLEVSGGSPSRGQTTGRTCFIDEAVLGRLTEPVIPASFCRLVRVDCKKVLPRFAYYWLQDMYRSGRAGTYENQSTGISNFQFERFLDAEAIILPSLDSQQRTVEVLAALDDRIDLLSQTNATLEATAQALFNSWFVDFDPVCAKAEGREPEGMDAATAALFPSEFEDSELGPMPKGWRRIRFGDVATQSKGSINPGAHPEQIFEHYSLPAFDAGQLPVSEAGEAIKSNKTPVPSGAVLVSKLNPHIPRIWFVGGVDENAVCSTEFLVWTPKPGMGSAFVYCMASSLAFNSAMRQLVTGTSNSHQRVKPDQLAEVRVAAINDSSAVAFEAIAAPFLHQVERNRQRAATLAQLRDTLLPRLISGKLRLPEADREVEAALA